MGNYTIQSTALNKSRVFILQKSELEKRWDTYYYLPEFIVLEEKLKNKNIKKISQIAERIFSGSTPLSKGDAYTDNKVDGIPFVRSGDFTIEGTINFEDLVYLKEEVHNTQLKSSKLKRNDLLFAIVGATIGKVGVYKNDKPANINQAICAVRLKKEFNVDYLNAYFQTSIGQKLIDRIKRPVARANVNIDEISTLPVIIPNNETQQKIISIFNNSLAQKQQNEAEADKLLSSIDDYLLNELGIKLPEPPENTLKNRMFTVSIADLSGNRYDPNYHQKYFQDVFSAFEKGKYEYSQIRKFASFQAGYAFKLSDYLEQSSCLLITIKNIRQNQIDIEDATYLPDDFFEQYKEFQIRNNDLLIAMTGATIGKVGIYNHPNNSLLNQRNGIIKPDNINSIYLMSLLNLSIFQKLILRNSNGGAQPNISETDIMRISIPVPPIDKQKEIAEHITGIRQQAQQLKDKTKDDLKKASEEIEKILLN